MNAGDTARQVVHLRRTLLRDWDDVPVVHAHAAFERAVAGFDSAVAGTVVSVLACRRLRQERSGGC